LWSSRRSDCSSLRGHVAPSPSLLTLIQRPRDPFNFLPSRQTGPFLDVIMGVLHCH
jgi:hypothetical protein